MKTLTASAVVLSCALATPATLADTLLGVYVGAQSWDMSSDGSFGNSTNTQANFNFDGKTQGSYYLSFEHFVPLVPNIKVKRNEFETNGNTTLTSTFQFNDVTYAVNSELATQADLTNTDIVLYYEIFDNDLISFDLGINAKRFDGMLDVVDRNDATRTAAEELSGWVPMLYGAVQVGLPMTGISFFADGSLLSIDDHTVYDYQAGLGYTIIDNVAIDVTVQLGYRATKVELEDLDNIYSNLDFDGAFLGVEAHF